MSFAYCTDKRLKGRAGDRANDGKKTEKDSVGADVEHVVFAAS